MLSGCINYILHSSISLLVPLSIFIGDPSILDFSRPANDVFAKAMSLKMNQPLSDSVRSLDGSSNDAIATSGSMKSLQIHPIVTSAPPFTESGAPGDVELTQLLKSLLAETKAQAASIKTLTSMSVSLFISASILRLSLHAPDYASIPLSGHPVIHFITQS